MPARVLAFIPTDQRYWGEVETGLFHDTRFEHENCGVGRVLTRLYVLAFDTPVEAEQLGFLRCSNCLGDGGRATQRHHNCRSD